MHKPESRTLPLKTLAALLLGLTLTACGGGDSGSRLDNINDGNTGGGNGGGDDGPVGENEPAQLGRGSADSFVAGEIEVGLPEGSSLAPGGTTTLVVTMVNNNGELVTSAVDVSFNSDCLASGRSVLTSNGEEVGTTVSTNNGRAEVTYSANGCVGADQITARATYEGLSAGSARATIDVASDTVQTVEFVGAEPEVIGLKGTGTQETSTVTFRVLGSTGSPVRDVDVDFSLTPAGIGGLSLVNTTATSNAAGEVSTTVQSGTFATSVRVTATIEAETGNISTQSSRLVVSTGIPDQNSISVAASDLHPVSWNYDGVESQITIRLADAFNNPAPDGTAVTFTSSGGAIDSSCTTEGGACTVTWRSQSPRPRPSAGFEITDDMAIICGPTADGACRPGRVKVLATALGNESFTDLNSNGIYDHSTDIFLSDNSEGQCAPNRPAPYAEVDEDGCDDLGSAYLDKNFNEDYDSNEEIVVLSDTEASDGSSYAAGDGIYNGVLCSDASQQAGECNRDAVTIRDDLMLVMSCHTPYTMADGRLPGQNDVTLSPGETTTVTVLLADCNGNGMPAGTTMDLNIQGDGFEADTSLSNELVGSSEPATVTIFITADDEEPASGAILMEITAPTPGGDVGTIPAAIGVSAAPAPSP
ncbi:hypothetical protein [Marinimicrobium agarilyticum]|uniref:hypothetical protein n=1 Tax=Marinimicrobium agarilyticum TaxID=306546 RepID=UPI00040428F3|nr:hypothetical protein [Marinimicrobium agarilyticum]